MPLPIPEIFPSRLPTDEKAREDLLLFQDLIRCCEPVLRSELVFNKQVKLEFPQIIASWLACGVQRSRLTAWGLVTAVNAPNEVLFVLSVRALLEMAALAAYVCEKMEQGYAGQMSRSELTFFAFRMKYATRMPADLGLNEREAELTKAINILTAIKSLDRFGQKCLGFRGDALMTEHYARLSEWCHPNSLGMSVGADSDFASGYDRFDMEPRIGDVTLNTFSYYAFLSFFSFLTLYNRCWDQLLEHSETLPTWKPAGDPRVDLS